MSDCHVELLDVGERAWGNSLAYTSSRTYSSSRCKTTSISLCSPQFDQGRGNWRNQSAFTGKHVWWNRPTEISPESSHIPLLTARAGTWHRVRPDHVQYVTCRQFSNILIKFEMLTLVFLVPLLERISHCIISFHHETWRWWNKRPIGGEAYCQRTVDGLKKYPPLQHLYNGRLV